MCIVYYSYCSSVVNIFRLSVALRQIVTISFVAHSPVCVSIIKSGNLVFGCSRWCRLPPYANVKQMKWDMSSGRLQTNHQLGCAVLVLLILDMILSELRTFIRFVIVNKIQIARKVTCVRLSNCHLPYSGNFDKDFSFLVIIRIRSAQHIAGSWSIWKPWVHAMATDDDDCCCSEVNFARGKNLSIPSLLTAQQQQQRSVRAATTECGVDEIRKKRIFIRYCLWLRSVSFSLSPGAHVPGMWIICRIALTLTPSQPFHGFLRASSDIL